MLGKGYDGNHFFGGNLSDALAGIENTDIDMSAQQCSHHFARTVELDVGCLAAGIFVEHFEGKVIAVAALGAADLDGVRLFLGGFDHALNIFVLAVLVYAQQQIIKADHADESIAELMTVLKQFNR